MAYSRFWICAAIGLLPLCSCNDNTGSGEQSRQKDFHGEMALFSKDRKVLLKFDKDKEIDVYAVPDGVEEIAEYAFYEAKVKKVLLPKGLKRIGERAFYDAKIVSMEIPGSVDTIKKETFASCENLHDLILHEGLVCIEDEAFRWCYNLTGEFTLPSTVRSIGRAAFSGQSEAETDVEDEIVASNMKIPEDSKLESVGNKGLRGPKVFFVPEHFVSPSITFSVGHPYYKVHENNPTFCSEDGVLFSKDKKTLISFPREKGGTYVMPNSVTNIGYDAFYQNDVLEKIVLSANLECFDSGFFKFGSYNALAEVVMPADTVTEDGEHAEIQNEYFSTQDGVLFNSDKSTLIYFPPGKKGERYEVPDQVEAVDTTAFVRCRVKNVIFKHSASLYAQSFWNVIDLERVDFLEYVGEIDYGVFNDCGECDGTYVKEVYFHKNTESDRPKATGEMTVSGASPKIMVRDESGDGFMKLDYDYDSE